MWHAWERRVSRVLVGKPEGKRPLARQGHRWENGIRMDLKENWGGGGIQVAKDRDQWWAVVNAMMNLWVLHHEVS
jgi:hypothetical protein